MPSSNCWFLAWGMIIGLALLISTVDLFVRDQQALKSYVNLLRLMVWRYLVLKVLTHSFPMHPFSSPWKHQKTVKFSDVFRGKRKGALGMNEFIDRKSLLILGTLLKLVRFKTTKCLSSTVPHMKFYTFPVGPDLVRINNKKTVNVARVIKINDQNGRATFMSHKRWIYLQHFCLLFLLLLWTNNDLLCWVAWSPS